jgi:hypothetical protein
LADGGLTTEVRFAATAAMPRNCTEACSACKGVISKQRALYLPPQPSDSDSMSRSY